MRYAKAANSVAPAKMSKRLSCKRSGSCQKSSPMIARANKLALSPATGFVEKGCEDDGSSKYGYVLQDFLFHGSSFLSLAEVFDFLECLLE